MPNTSTGIYYPPAGAPATLRTFFTNLATTADAAIVTVRNNLTTAIQNALTQALNAAAGARAHAEDAHRLNQGTSVGTGSTIDVATGHQGIPSCDFALPANVGAQVTATFDVVATTVNGACTFSGRLNAINLNAPAANYLSRAAVRRFSSAGDRVTVSQTWSLGPTTFGRRIQAVVVKDNSNAAMTIDPTNCTLSYVLNRSGSA